MWPLWAKHVIWKCTLESSAQDRMISPPPFHTFQNSIQLQSSLSYSFSTPILIMPYFITSPFTMSHVGLFLTSLPAKCLFPLLLQLHQAPSAQVPHRPRIKRDTLPGSVDSAFLVATPSRMVQWHLRTQQP